MKAKQAGQWGIIGLGLLAVVFAIWRLVGMGNSAMAGTAERDLIDAVTLETFESFRIPEGEGHPYEHPRTGDRTLFPVEKCFWTADGKGKLEPTLVLLNGYAGKDGPTLCPDCGRQVTLHNPTPPADIMAEAAGVTLD